MKPTAVQTWEDGDGVRHIMLSDGSMWEQHWDGKWVRWNEPHPRCVDHWPPRLETKGTTA